MSSYPLAQVKEYFFKLVPELNDEKWKHFEKVSTIRHLKKGEVILKPGQVERNVSFINSGLIRLYHLVDGKEVVHAFFPENCYYADYESFLTQSGSHRYADVLEDTEVVDMTFEGLQWLYAQMPECERAGRKVAEDLYVYLSNKISSFLIKTPEQRYLEFLDLYPNIPQRVPQYMIASYLGITPEALSRIRSRMSRKPVERFVDSNQ